MWTWTNLQVMAAYQISFKSVDNFSRKWAQKFWFHTQFQPWMKVKVIQTAIKVTVKWCLPSCYAWKKSVHRCLSATQGKTFLLFSFFLFFVTKSSKHSSLPWILIRWNKNENKVHQTKKYPQHTKSHPNWLRTLRDHRHTFCFLTPVALNQGHSYRFKV